MAADEAFLDCSLAAHIVAIKSTPQFRRGILQLLSEMLQNTAMYTDLEGPEKKILVHLG